MEKFKAAVGVAVEKFPAIARADEVPPPYAAGTGTMSMLGDPFAAAFGPKS